MLLNSIEKALMNNPVRAAVQRRFEAMLDKAGLTLVGSKEVFERFAWLVAVKR